MGYPSPQRLPRGEVEEEDESEHPPAGPKGLPLRLAGRGEALSGSAGDGEVEREDIDDDLEEDDEALADVVRTARDDREQRT